MKNRWINLLFGLLVILIGGLSFHLFVLAQTTEAVGLILNILKPLNILLISILLFVVSRNLLKLYLGYRNRVAGFRLQTRLVLALLPLTLLPSIALFFLSTSFVDDFLSERLKNPEQTELLTATNDFTERHFDEVGAFYAAHSERLAALLHTGDRARIVAYLDRYHISGASLFEGDSPARPVLASNFPEKTFERVRRRFELRDLQDELTHFDDGSLMANYRFGAGANQVQMLYYMDSGFSERYLFLRDSYVFLRYGQKKNDKLGEIVRGILLITTLTILFGGIWVALRFSRHFQAGFRQLIESAGRISAGDLDTRVDLETGDEMEDVATAFNNMAATLKANQRELEQRARDLLQLNGRLQAEIRYSQVILEQTRAGVASLDEGEGLRDYNSAFSQILRLNDPERGRVLGEVLAAPGYAPLRELVAERLGSSGRTRQLELTDPDGNPLHIAASIAPLRIDSGERLGDLLVIEDLSELMEAQKQAAWRDVAKRVAHEIKNPLTPIQLSIQRVERKARKGAEDLVEAVYSAHETIMSETSLLKNLVDEFSTYAKLPTPVKAEVDLRELILSVCTSYRPVHSHIRIETQFAEGPFLRSLDASQFRQVLGNLLNNAAQASEQDGRVTVGLAHLGERVLLYVDDEGRGIPESDREKVFLPYYSKSPKGTGLGLAIVKRIIADHDGVIEALARESRGTRIAITLP